MSFDEQTDAFLRKIVKNIEIWNERRDLGLAREIEMQLTLLKAMIGSSAFGELKSFARAEREVTKFMDSEEK